MNQKKKVQEKASDVVFDPETVWSITQSVINER